MLGFDFSGGTNDSWDNGDWSWISDFTGGGYSPNGGSYSAPSVDVKEVLTADANSSEQALRSNLGLFQSGQINADTALAKAWQIFQDMIRRFLSQGAQGQRSAAERDRRIDPAQLRWDWIAYYIDPISGTATAASNMPALPTDISSNTILPAATGTTIPWWFIIGLAAALFIGMRK